MNGPNIVSITAGAVLIAVTLWDVFNDLFHPAAHSAFGDWLARRLFNLLRHSRNMHSLAGPLAVILIILSWVVGLVLGFALIFGPKFPQDFLTSTGTTPIDPSPALTVIYFSFQTLITLGYGDLIPASQPVRFLASCEALIGFGLLTASISSVVLIYPALARTRMLARSIAHAVESERTSGLSIVRANGENVLMSLAQQITQARIDLIHFPITYYFTVSNLDVSLSKWIFEVERLAREGAKSDCEPRIRLAACTLELALDEFARIVAQRFLPRAPQERGEILKAFAADHAAAT
jgi:hypothetical protein